MRVRLSSEARQDLLAIGDYIARDNPPRAQSFVAELAAKCASLGEMPKAYPLVPRYAQKARRARARIFGHLEELLQNGSGAWCTQVHGDVFGGELVASSIGEAFCADGVFGPVRVDGGDTKGLALSSECPAIVGGLQSEAAGEGFEQGLVGREDRAIGHRDADAEPDAESMAQVDVAELAALDSQPVGFGHAPTGGEQISAQAITERRRQVAWRRHLGGVCLRWWSGRCGWFFPAALSHIEAFAL